MEDDHVRIPITFVRRGGRKVIIAPDGGDAWAPAKPRPDETLIRALARAHRWKRLLEEGKYRSAGEIAEAEGVTRSFVNRLLRLTLLAPDIVEAILDGTAAEGHAAGGADAGDAERVGRAEEVAACSRLITGPYNSSSYFRNTMSSPGIGPANIAKRLGACSLAASCLWFS